jgi:hypothetical protein
MDPGVYHYEEKVNQRSEFVFNVYDPGYGHGREGRTNTYAEKAKEFRERYNGKKPTIGESGALYAEAYTLDAYDHGAMFKGIDELSNLEKDQLDAEIATTMLLILTEGLIKGPKPKEKLVGHHTYIKALGGDPDQKLSYIIESLHASKGGIHSELSKFEGGWLYPTRGAGKRGVDIIAEHGQEKIIQGLTRFYSQKKWKFLMDDFKEAVEFTIANSKK